MNVSKTDIAPSPSGKRATNLSLSVHTLELAKEMGMNLSNTVDRLLGKEVQRRYKAHWQEKNRAAIDAYSLRVEQEVSRSTRIR